METFWAIAVGSSLLIAVGLAGWWFVRCAQRRNERDQLTKACALFRRRREWLEADFATRAAERDRARDVVWTDCDFEDEVAFARDRATGQLRALVGMTISFEADEPRSLDEADAICALHAATAVFSYEDGTWCADGRAILNLSPRETIDRFQHELEPLD